MDRDAVASRHSQRHLNVPGPGGRRRTSADRVWNQHAYHVIDVPEGGTIPQFEPPSWEQLSTFRGGSLEEPPTVAQDPLI